MEILRAGYNFRHSAKFKINRPTGSGDHLLLIIKTEAFVILGEKRESLAANSAIVFKKGTPQIYGAVTDKFINDWIHFNVSEEEEKEFEALGVPFDTPIPLKDASELSRFIKNIAFERYSDNMHKNATMQKYFDLILLKLSEKLHDDNPDREHPLYGQFCKLRNEILLEPQNDWSIDTICKRVILSRSHVQHLYKQFFETSITDDVKRGRIERAKYLLSRTDMTVTAISCSCGYESDVHFMRLFKKETGRTPSEYRSEFRYSAKEKA